MDASTLLVVAIGLWALAVAVLGIVYHPRLMALWIEPVLRQPVLVVESDDWGAGPLVQAEALDRLIAVLARHTDHTGRQPTMNLAVILAVPDTQAFKEGGQYRRLRLDEPAHAPVRNSLLRGQSTGVFSLHLHGMEHYWPPSLMISGLTEVQAWLQQPTIPATEDLPSHLQSRWVDASVLPSRPHPRDVVQLAAREEVHAFQEIFGVSPRVVVPPTFVWTRDVEAAWSELGIETLVTPGYRYTCRDADGGSGGAEGPIVNGQRSSRLTCVVRTDYFEPRKGRGAAHALAALDRDVALGRPCVLENHRDNFCGDAALRDGSLAELDVLLREALARHPALRFMSTVELGRILRDRDPHWLVLDWRGRLTVFWQRVRASGRPWKLMRLCGISAPLSWIVRHLGAQRRPAAGPGVA